MKKVVIAALAVLFAMACLLFTFHVRSSALAGTTVDPEKEIMKSLSTPVPGSATSKPSVKRANDSPQTVIEGIRRSASRSRRLFRGAQFICILPIEKPALTTTIHDPGEAVAAVMRLKQEGVEEIWLRSPASEEVIEAILKTAKAQDIRVNV